MSNKVVTEEERIEFICSLSLDDIIKDPTLLDYGKPSFLRNPSQNTSSVKAPEKRRESQSTSGIKKHGKPEPIPDNIGNETNGHVFVRNLKYDMKSKKLRSIFEPIGRLVSADIHCYPNGKSSGTATVVFERFRDAEYACNSLDGKIVDGRHMRLNIPQYSMLLNLQHSEANAVKPNVTKPNEPKPQTKPDPPKPAQPNPVQPNSAQPKPVQPKPTQPKPTPGHSKPVAGNSNLTDVYSGNAPEHFRVFPGYSKPRLSREPKPLLNGGPSKPNESKHRPNQMTESKPNQRIESKGIQTKPKETVASVVTPKDRPSESLKRSLSAEELDKDLEEYAAERKKRQRYNKFGRSS